MRHLTLEFALYIPNKIYYSIFITAISFKCELTDMCLQHKISNLNLKDSEPLIYICSYNTKMNTLK